MPPGQTNWPLRPVEVIFRSKDLPQKLKANDLSPTTGPLQVGVALACIGVVLFEVRVARATSKVYKSPPLIETFLECRQILLTSHRSISAYFSLGEFVCYAK